MKLEDDQTLFNSSIHFPRLKKKISRLKNKSRQLKKKTEVLKELSLLKNSTLSKLIMKNNI